MISTIIYSNENIINKIKNFLKLDKSRIFTILGFLLINLLRHNNNFNFSLFLIKNNILDLYLNLLKAENIDEDLFEIIFELIMLYFKGYSIEYSLENQMDLEKRFNEDFENLIFVIKNIFEKGISQITIKSLANFYHICSNLIFKENFYKGFIKSEIIKYFLNYLLLFDFEESEIYVKVLVKLIGLLFTNNENFKNYLLDEIKILDYLHFIYKEYFGFLYLRKLIFLILLKICYESETGLINFLDSGFTKEIKNELCVFNSNKSISLLITNLCILSLLCNTINYDNFNKFYSKELLHSILELIENNEISDIFVFELILYILEKFESAYNIIFIEKNKVKDVNNYENLILKENLFLNNLKNFMEHLEEYQGKEKLILLKKKLNQEV